jgi:glycosyltransferase involved in cell wall biosynthesis
MGLLVLLDGFVQVYQEYPQARLWLAGRGPQEAALRSRIQAAGLADRVRLLGLAPEPELPRLLSATDCLVMPSLDLEGFGLATVESLACGTPVLGSRAGANPELLGPLSEGLLFEAGSSAAVANSMRAVLAQPDRLPSRSRCRQYAMQFSWDRPVSAFEQCYGELVAGGSPR